MKNVKKIISTFILTAILAGTIMAQDVTVESSDFKNASKNAIVVDAYTASNYAKMHIQDAINIPHKELYKEGEIEGLLKDPATLAKYFGEKGLTNDAKIIIYDDGSQKYNSRVYWTLKYMGANNVHLLHKDMGDWRKARIRLTRRPASSKAATFNADVQAGMMADMAETIAASNGDGILVDARAAGEFAGKEKDSKGHIKNAVNINYELFLDESGAYKSKDEIMQVASSKGLSPEKKIIAYCTSSIRAAVIYIALVDIAGFENVKVYDGAYNEMLVNKPGLIVK